MTVTTDFAQARSHMVEGQIRIADVTEPRLVRVLRGTAREVYLPPAQQHLAYADVQLPVADGRFELRPRDMAKMLQALNIKSNDRALVLASGVGYVAGLVAQLAAQTVAVEPLAALAKLAASGHAAIGVDVDTHINDLTLLPTKLGTFDAIFVNGAVARMPQAWLALLNPAGRLVGIESGRAHLYVQGLGGVSAADVFDATGHVLPGMALETGFVF